MLKLGGIKTLMLKNNSKGCLVIKDNTILLKGVIFGIFHK